MITYKDAGVDIDAGENLVDRIKPLAKKTRTPFVVDGIGGFAGLCKIPLGMKNPILVSGTDGVGTKLDIAFRLEIHDTIGIDLVAMCVNDVITIGAKPLFFLDYFATGRLDVSVGEKVINGIVNGCRQADCALLGGETAEMPGIYDDGIYDLAGFTVGVVERDKIINGNNISCGDIVIGVASSGIHSNGFSLVRRIVDNYYTQTINGERIGKVLLTPTKIYSRAINDLVSDVFVHGICHITGGGLPGNLPRIIPNGLCAQLNLASYEVPEIFNWLEKTGPVDSREMFRTFNMGVGLCVIVDKYVADDTVQILQDAGEKAWIFGEIIKGKEKVCFI